MPQLTTPNGPPDVRYDVETIPVFARWFGSWQISVRRRALSMDQLAHLYDLAAPGWCRTLDRLGYPRAYEAMLRSVLREKNLGTFGTQLRALDCGVGTGALSCALARMSPASTRLDAIDISPLMLRRASRNLRGNSLKVSLRDGDVRDLPYDDGVFDLVMTAHMLEHLVDPSVALREMVRVLKPGGLLIACLTRRSSLGMYVHLKWRTHRVPPDEAQVWLRESGLENTRCLPVNDHAICRRLSLVCVGAKGDRGVHAEVAP